MISGLYGAATAMVGIGQAQDVHAENLAHANVPGYRRRGVATESFEQALYDTEVGEAGDRLWGSEMSTVYDDFTPGPVQATGNPLDLAPVGDTFFVLEGTSGPAYTRNGSFRLNAEGELESVSGLRVQGDGGPIAIPPETVQIVFSRDGAVLADGVEVGRLQLVQLPNPEGMSRVGTTLFEGGSVPPGSNTPGVPRIEQGFREGSNVQVVQEMVAMINGQRHYEAAQRVLRGIAETISLRTRPQPEA
jgi:flagellar basal body rod protein FlgG